MEGSNSVADTERLVLDLSGLKCPLPSLKVEKALARLEKGRELDITCTDPMAAIDIPNLVRETGNILVEQSSEGDYLRFQIRKT